MQSYIHNIIHQQIMWSHGPLGAGAVRLCALLGEVPRIHLRLLPPPQHPIYRYATALRTPIHIHHFASQIT
jgi:hypothetical protein